MTSLLAVDGGQPAAFAHDTWWLVLIKVVLAFVLLLLMTLFAIMFER